eukprot:CAMPEP_0197174508 /NCGR_PEP_ID=MMETSP1423-20130617/999_1 /TAXON_ID=476441 /ORGANISM="Pseudo-nitzschia heimii, Strain UNC1101" /LENGTH=195 /DNA_ID=CAMNT_0042623449 /DNA_START=135 /DNA_END=722 /DNA_ORIENTATION=+
MNPLRIVFGPVSMVPSNLVAWYLVWTAHQSSSLEQLRSSVWKIALFYALWAVFNIVSLGRDDLGCVTFGILFVTTVLSEEDSSANAFLREVAGFLARLRIAACVLVVMNFAVVFPMISKAGGLWAFGEMVWNRYEASLGVKLWAIIFASYIASNVALWSFCGYLFFRFQSRNRDEESYYTTPIVQQNEYQPIQSV